MTRTRVLCADLGGTRLKAGVVDGAAVQGFTTAATAGFDADQALDAVTTTGRRLLAEHGADGVGLSVPGIVDAGRVTALPGKFDGMVGLDLCGELGRTLDLPVTVVNDAVAYATGEARHGAGAGHDRVVVVTIGTGVGVGVLEDALPVAGGPLGAGILGGHIPIADCTTGPSDTNGRRGTVEARCAAESLVVYAREAGGAFDDIPGVYAAAAAGDRAALEGLDTYRRWLVRGLLALAHAHAPSVIVLGGGPMRAGSPVVDGLQQLLDERLWPGYAVTLRLAERGDEAPLLGVAHLATTRET